MSRIPIKTVEEINLMKVACGITSSSLDAVGEIIKPGVSTEDIDQFVVKMTKEAGATAAPLNYKGFPKSVCTSINEVVCHGIPSKKDVLKAGDIVNVDVTSIKDGYHGDASRMFMVGGPEACSEEAVELVSVSYQCLMKGMQVVKPGAYFGDIGAVIQEFIESHKRQYGIVREYTGHGIGKLFHEAPQVLHVGKWGTGPVMKAGMTFTIEPMINLGTWRTELCDVDDWTVTTSDGKLSAQWEHTILVTESGCEALTQSDLLA